MIDMVPKAISLTLVTHSKDNLQRELLQELYKPEVLDDLLKESEYVVSRRKEVVSMVQALNKAEEYVISSCFAVIYNMLLICLSLFASSGLCPAYERSIPAFPFSHPPLLLAHCIRNPPHALPAFSFSSASHIFTHCVILGVVISLRLHSGTVNTLYTCSRRILPFVNLFSFQLHAR